MKNFLKISREISVKILYFFDLKYCNIQGKFKNICSTLVVRMKGLYLL